MTAVSCRREKMDEDEELNLEDEIGEDTEEDTDEEIGEEDADEEIGEEETDEEDDLLEGVELEEKPSKRANDRIRALAKRAKDAEAQALKIRQEADELRAKTISVDPGDVRRRQEFLDSLSDDDRRSFLLEEQMNGLKYQLSMNEFRTQDATDKATYEAQAATNPLLQRFASKVEAKLQEMRAQQRLNAPRIEVLKYLVGEAVLKSKGKAVSKKDATNRVKKQSTKPTKATSDVNSGRRGKDERSERNKRLDSYRF